MTIYVDSNATGANDGTSWTDAYTDITSSGGAGGAAAGEHVYVAYNHSQATSHNPDWSNGTAANPVIISSRDPADDSYRLPTSAQLTASDMIWDGDIRVFGIWWSGSDDLFLDGQSGHQEYHDCTFEVGDQFKIQSGLIRFFGCTFKHDDDISSTGQCWAFFTDCTFEEKSNYSKANLFSITQNTRWFFRCCKFGPYDATLTGIVGGASSGRVHIQFMQCEFPSGLTFAATSTSLFAEAFNCDEGTISDPPLGIFKKVTYQGDVTGTLSRYRTGGADDGEQANAYSWEMATNANAKEQFCPLESPPMLLWLDGTETSIKVYVASGGTLNNDDFWIDVGSPSEIANPNQTAQGQFDHSRMAIDGTPAALTTDSSSTWNGTGVGTKQQISVTIAPTIAGPVVVRAFLAKPSTTVYVDPKPEAA